MTSNQERLRDWYQNQLKGYNNLTDASGGIANTRSGDRLNSTFYQLQNNLNSPDFNQLLDYATQNVGGNINAALKDIQTKNQQQRQLDRWYRSQAGALGGLTEAAGGIANTRVGDLLGSTYAQLQNQINNPNSQANFQNALQQQGGRIGNIISQEQSRANAQRGDGGFGNIASLGAMLLAPGLGSILGSGLGLGGAASSLLGSAAGGALNSAIRGGDIGRGALGGLIGGGIGLGTNYLGNAMGLGGDLMGNLARGAIRSGLSNIVSDLMPQQRPQSMAGAPAGVRPSKEGFQQWLAQNQIKDPGTAEGRALIMQQYRKSIG